MSATATTAIVDEQSNSLGTSVPPFTPHAISVSLPTWRDNVGYEEGEKRVVDAMVTGYPRFFIHLSIQKLARICEQKFGIQGEKCLLCPTKRIADQCRAFILNQTSQSGSPINVRLIQFLICPEDKQNKNMDDDCDCDSTHALSTCVELHIVLFPEGAFSVAKQFWQHTGMGISSRLAEHCLAMLPEDVLPSPVSAPPMNRLPSKGNNRHYSVKGSRRSLPSSPTQPQAAQSFGNHEALNKDHSIYVEERYGRNLPLSSASAAKRALRRRIAGVLVRDNTDDCPSGPCAGENDVEVGPSSRGVEDVTEDDAFLFPTGMCAIWQAHNLALAVLPPSKSVCFGFPYTDTLKILQKWGPGCHFLGRGVETDIDALERILHDEVTSPTRDHDSPPILALFTEFPSNPLLRSANLPRLRALADKYNFLVVIDETIGNFVNVEVLPYADIVVSSLSKVFSGDANVMGGSLVLNPKGRHYNELKSHLKSTYEDFYFDEDAIYMERNSRNFISRIRVIDENTEAVCDYLHSHSVAGGASSPAIKEVFYPKWITRDHYEHCRIKHAQSTHNSTSPQEGGFGGLFSLTFTSIAASRAFFDALPSYKGPSLGTNFTLACPYTILAHYTELEWAAKFGVEEGLVRISVGMEQRQVLLAWMEKALKAAESVLVSG